MNNRPFSSALATALAFGLAALAAASGPGDIDGDGQPDVFEKLAGSDWANPAERIAPLSRNAAGTGLEMRTATPFPVDIAWTFWASPDLRLWTRSSPLAFKGGPATAGGGRRVQPLAMPEGQTSQFLKISAGAFDARAEVDFANPPLGAGYPDQFGVVVKAPRAHTAAWDMIEEHGVTLVRVTSPLDRIVPDSTVENYLGNTNNIQDPDTWNWADAGLSGGDDFSWAIALAKVRGIRVYQSISYVPAWLSHSGTTRGVPKNWEVWRDIVGKIAARFHGQADRVGIWNEPDHTSFIDLTGSPYTNRQSAYLEIAANGFEAVRAAGQSAPLGGPDLANSSLDWWLGDLLDDPRAGPLLGFATYHQYTTNPGSVFNNWVDEAASHGRAGLPICLTEWNGHSGVSGATQSYMSGVQSLALVGFRLIHHFLQGIHGAALYMMVDRDLDAKTFGLYQWNGDGTVTPHPNMRAFRLLSRQAGLGDGPSQAFAAITEGLSNAGGAINAAGDRAMFASNNSAEPRTARLGLANIARQGALVVEIFAASGSDDASTPVARYTIDYHPTDGPLHATVDMEPYSLAAMVVRGGTNSTAGTPIQIEAESYNEAGGEVTTGTVSEGTYVSNFSSGDWLGYDVNPDAAVAQITVRYASGSSYLPGDPNEPRLELRLGGPTGTLLAAFAAHTGAWGAFTSKTVDVEGFNAGPQRLCLVAPTAGGVRVNWLQLRFP